MTDDVEDAREPSPMEGVNPAVAQMMKGMQERFEKEHPLFSRLDFKMLKVARGEIEVALTVPSVFADEEDIHSGFFTIVLDSIFGMATFLSLDEIKPIATINLKTASFSPRDAGGRVRCEALCDGIADDVAVVHGRATAEDGTLIATAAATFMVGTRSAQVSRI
jgi:acyl-coenzyme A thioesterase PaaI-like protein